MRVAVVADAHAGNHKRCGGPWTAGYNRRCLQAAETFRSALVVAREMKADVLYVLGDLFDVADPTPQVVNLVQRALLMGASSKDPDGKPLRVVVLPGNHDAVSSESGDHALGPLSFLEGVTLQEGAANDEFLLPRDRRLIVSSAAYVPGVRVQDQISLLLEHAAPDPKVQRIVLFHAGIRTEKTPAYLRDAENAVGLQELNALAEQHGVRAFMAGDWHERSYVQPPYARAHVLQVGALCPTGWDNPGGSELYGTLAFWDTEEKKGRGALDWSIIRGPRFFRVPWKDARSKAEWEASPHEGGDGAIVYLSLAAREEEREPALALLEQLRGEGLVCDGDVDVSEDREAVKARVQEAAAAASSAETLQEALAAAAADLPLPDGVDRAAVLNRARAALAG